MWRLGFLAFVPACTLFMPTGPADAQEVLTSPQLKLVGPENQLVYAFVQYFDEGNIPPLINMRWTIRDEGKPIELEFGHAGIQILVFVPSKSPVTATLLDGEDVVTQGTAAENSIVELRFGKVPSDYEARLPRVALDDEERVLARKFLSGLSDGLLANMVSESDRANIQWQTLEAYCKALKLNLGELNPQEMELDGWLSWSGNLGARVIGGNAGFENGACFFGLVVIDGELFDVIVDCPTMPDNWFQGIPSEDQMITNAEKLIRSFFDQSPDSVQEVQDGFAKQYRKEITLEKIAALRSALKEKYGQKIVALKYVRSFLAPFDSAADKRDLNFFHLVNFENGMECIAQTSFTFSSRKDFVGRGSLSAFNVRQSWPSAAPEQATVAEEFLKQSLAGAVDLSLLHPDLAAVLDEGRWQEQIRALKQLGKFSIPSFATWSGNAIRANAFANGWLETEKGATEVRFDFAEDKIVAVSFLAPHRFWHSRETIRDERTPGRVAHSFWTRIFSEDFYDAHRYLSPEFQKQLTDDTLKEIVTQSGFQREAKVRRIEIDSCLVTNRLDRSYNVLASVYLIATFQDGTQQPLRCELLHRDAEWSIVDFTSDFSERFPKENGQGQFIQVIQALNSQDADALIEMLSAGIQTQVEKPLLVAYLSQVQAIAGELEYRPDDIQIVHEYFVGGRAEFATAALIRKDSGRTVRLNATFRFGELVSFGLEAEELSEFINRLEDPNYFARRTELAIQEWMKSDRGLTPLLATELKDGEKAVGIAEMKGTWLLTLGTFQGVTTVAKSSAQAGVANTRAELKFEMGTVQLDVSYSYDAFRSEIRAIEHAQ